MLAKRIDIPKFLHEIHGESAPLYNLLSVYCSGISVALLFSIKLYTLNVSLWNILVSAFVWFDIGGGVVANLSSPTNRFFVDKAKSRILFLAIHIIQPGVIALLFPKDWVFFSFVYFFTILSCITIALMKSNERQQVFAGLLVALGITLAIVLFRLSIPALMLFAPLFMIKLILGFSVKRPSFDMD